MGVARVSQLGAFLGSWSRSFREASDIVDSSVVWDCLNVCSNGVFMCVSASVVEL